MQIVPAHDLFDTLVLPSWLHDAKDMEEEVDEVQIEADSSHDVFLGGELVHNHMCVKYDEPAEQQSSSNGNHKLQRLTPEKYLYGGSTSNDTSNDSN